jgi:hypothetical protein
MGSSSGDGEYRQIEQGGVGRGDDATIGESDVDARRCGGLFNTGTAGF